MKRLILQSVNHRSPGMDNIIDGCLRRIWVAVKALIDHLIECLTHLMPSEEEELLLNSQENIYIKWCM
jgi:hypothetical protein